MSVPPNYSMLQHVKNNKIKPTKRDHTRPHTAHYTMPITLPFLLGSMALSKSIKMSHHPSSNSTNSPSNTNAPKSKYLGEGFFIIICNANSTPCRSIHDDNDTAIPSRIDRTMKELQNEPPTVA
mmetsp:Transcript_24978/g.49863  ORF Transcript_24978/g.49863 Transcript_24978/m.49863 type:complete len:124 (-) Transcript_24978:4-375(-)